MRMRHIVICGLPRSYNSFSTYLTNGAIFEKKIEHKIYVLSVSKNLHETFSILRIIERNMINILVFM